jgi:predicted nucleic acid-binding protein
MSFGPLANVVVADAGPLIALARSASLTILTAVFARTLMTRTILNECLARSDRPDANMIRSAVDSGWLEVVPEVTPAGTWGIDAGETSAIGVARTLGVGLLMDDRAGRRIAASPCSFGATIGTTVPASSSP